MLTKPATKFSVGGDITVREANVAAAAVKLDRNDIDAITATVSNTWIA